MRRSMWWVLVVCLCVSLPLAAQKFTGTIRGVVTDSTGAAIAGADVTVTNASNGAVRSMKSSDHGEFVFPELDAGRYDLSVKQANFKEYVSKGIELSVSSTATANVTMAVGAATEQVFVEASAVQVETSSGAVGNVIEGNEVRELPLNGRSFAQLIQLMPGVSPQAGVDTKNKGLLSGVDISVNGNNTTGNVFLVDGVNNNDIGSNRTILIYPSIDAIEEFKILRNSYGPEYGQAMGAVVSIITKSGTNQFHGSGYYFGRNDALNATDYFNKQNGVKKDKLRRNDYGYTIGGPIVKDKLFFFWSQEWNKELRGRLRSATVPTALEKTGDFSNIRLGCENAPVADVGDGTGSHVQTAVPSLNISPTGFLIASLFPDPNVASPVNCNNWAVSLSSPTPWREENVKIDYKLGKTWSVMGRYTQDHWSQPSPSALGFWGDDPYPSVDPSWKQPGYQATVRITKLFGDSAVNDFQVSYAANRISIVAAGDNPGIIQQINKSYTTYFPASDKFLGADTGYPVFWGGLGNGANSSALWNMGPWHNNEELYILKDDFSKVHGAHTFKVGFLASNNKKNELTGNSGADAANYWAATQNNTGNGTFNALWDQVMWGFGEAQTNPFSQTRWHDYEFYFGDTWKVSRNVTLEYGARWSFLRNPFSATNKISSWQPGLYVPALGGAACNGLLLVPAKVNPCVAFGPGFEGGVPGVNRSLKENLNHAISPRIGVAWDPRGDGKMVLRGGFGQFYQRERVANYLFLATSSPFSLNVGGERTLSGSVVGPLQGQASPSWGMDPRADLPNTYQWNLTFEREVARGSKMEIAYVGNHGSNVLRYKDANAVLPANRLNFALNGQDTDRFAGSFKGINYAEWTAHSSYHALQALFRTRIKALDGQAAYTWSKSLSDTDITNSGGAGATTSITDIANPGLDYGPTPVDRRHVFTASLVYNFPDLKGRSAPMRWVAGGWEAGGILSYASGPSLTIFGLNGGAVGAPGGIHAPGGIQGTGFAANQRPNRVLRDCRSHGGSKEQWFNPDAFTLDNYQLGTFGDSSVGSCTGPGLANTDFSLFKNFKVNERVGVQLRFEFFNFFNKTQFRADQVGTQLANDAQVCGSSTLAVCAGHAANTVGWRYAATTNLLTTDPNYIQAYGTGNFGRATGTRGPREIQYALKITF